MTKKWQGKINRKNFKNIKTTSWGGTQTKPLKPREEALMEEPKRKNCENQRTNLKMNLETILQGQAQRMPLRKNLKTLRKNPEQKKKTPPYKCKI